MLKLTKKVEYALMALRHIQAAGEDAVCSARVIAEEYDIPYELLAKTLQQIARDDVITAVQGPRGGYKLKKDPSTINLLAFIEIIEGPVGLSDCSIVDDCDRADVCIIREPIHQINENIQEIFKNIYLDQITLGISK